MEEIQFALRIPQRKPWGTMTKNIQSALELTADVPGMVRGVPSAKADEAMDLINQINKGLYRYWPFCEDRFLFRTCFILLAYYLLQEPSGLKLTSVIRGLN